MAAWKDVTKHLPTPNVLVDVSYGLLGIRAAVCDDWVSEGWITQGGNWSVKATVNTPKFPKPSHWKYKDINLL